MPSSSSPTPWTWCAVSPGTNCASYPTRARPRGSRAPAGRCSNGPRTSPATLRKLRARGGDVWRAYSLKESFRAIFAGDLAVDDAGTLLDRWCSKASRSRLPSFVRVTRTIRKHRDGILAAIELGVNNARAEGLNNHVRLITRRAYGFHSAQAALALVMLSCGPIELRLPHEPEPG